MKIQVPHLLLVIYMFGHNNISAQANSYDTIKVMTYNVANFGSTSKGCPTLLNDVKSPLLRTILDYASPDILGLEKMSGSPKTFATDTVMVRVLDSICQGCYAHAAFTNSSGYSKTNMLYYKKAKFGLISSTTIYAGDKNVSDINLHRLYYKSNTLNLTHDTIFINVIVVHLLSGSSSANKRDAEISGVMNWLNANVTLPGNYILMGDMNTQNSSENCFQKLITSSNPNTLFADPPINWATGVIIQPPMRCISPRVLV